MNFRVLKIYYPAIIVFLTLLFFTFFAFYQAKVAATEKREELFHNRAQNVYSAIDARMVDYIQILKGCQGLFYGSDSITARDWKIYIDNLNINKIYPGIQGIAYAPFIASNEITKLENSIRKSGFPAFKIRSTFKNSHLTPIIYIEPFKGRNLRAFGFDMYSDEIRRKAIERAIQSGEASMTSKVTLVQETSSNIQPGFLLYLPVYKNPAQPGNLEARITNTKGFVYYPFRAHDMMQTITNRFSDVRIRIYDGDKNDERNLLFDSFPGKLNKGTIPLGSEDFTTNQKLSIAGSTWNVIVNNTEDFGSETEKNQPVIILLFGLLVSFLFLLMIYNIIRTNRQVRVELQLSKELDYKKDEFIGIASHELKTPLTSIKAYIQLLERSELNAQARNYVVKANSNVNKLNNLIADLLDVSKLQSGQLQLNVAQIELKTMISESIENVQHMYSSHKIVLQNPIPDVVLNGDIVRLEQAMTNLLVNAIKYSPGANAVYIETEQMGSQIKILVKDQGIGISKANQEKIFDRFFRARELSPVLSGLGMGLFISSEIIKRHNGKIGVISEPGKGSTFYIILPVE